MPHAVKPKRERPLNARERAFIAAYQGHCRGNATKAAIFAGYPARSAYSAASRLLKQVKIRRALNANLDRKFAAEVLTAEQIDKRLSEIVAHGEEHASIRAAAELNKCHGRHSLKIEHAGRLTLEAAIVAGRTSDTTGRTET